MRGMCGVQIALAIALLGCVGRPDERDPSIDRPTALLRGFHHASVRPLARHDEQLA